MEDRMAWFRAEQHDHNAKRRADHFTFGAHYHVHHDRRQRKVLPFQSLIVLGMTLGLVQTYQTTIASRNWPSEYLARCLHGRRAARDG
jgi:hypothetical protein